MKRSIYSFIFLSMVLLVALSILTSCNFLFSDNGDTNPDSTPNRSFKILFQDQNTSLLTAKNLFKPNSTVFAFGIKGNQSGILTVGNSDNNDITMPYGVSTKTQDGTVLGTNGVAETFILPDPSVSYGLPEGSAVTAKMGIFLVRFGDTVSTTLDLTKIDNSNQSIFGDLSEINEIILRTGVWGERTTDGTCTVLTQPHFIITDNEGKTKTFSQNSKNLLINEKNSGLGLFEYIFFVPASIVGKGFTYYVYYDNYVEDTVVSSPVTNYYDTLADTYIPWDEWVIRDDWIQDDAGNAGLFDMIDHSVGISKDQRASSADWKNIAEYFQSFFIKYFKSQATMFSQANDNQLGSRSSFLVIALDDTEGKLLLNQNDSVEITYNSDEVAMEILEELYNPIKLNLTSSPPLSFSASVISSSTP